MKLYTDDFLDGMHEMLTLYKQGNNIFDMKGGNLFPHNTAQKSWEMVKDTDAIHLSDGTHTYSFKGELGDSDSDLERMPDVPLPDIFGEANKKNKKRTQVHRSDPGSIYFTVQEGHQNPTYTLKHIGDNKWKAIPKPRKVKDMLKQPLTPHNVNLESVKEGMLKELENITKEGFDVGELGHNVNSFLGKALQQAVNLPTNLALAAGRTGPVSYYGDPNPNASQSLTGALGNASIAAGVGAAGGGAYHLAKRHLLNTPAENEQEDQEGGHAMKRILAPTVALGGLNLASRSMFPRAINNPEMQALPGV